jgi:predicted NAD/FAD-dependent oxidoreductase
MRSVHTKRSATPGIGRETSTDILIIGAGMAGLTAASSLHESGQHVLVVDKSRGVGGRLASRRIAQATLDHGAQFITARDPRFAAAVETWQRLGVVDEWFRTSVDGSDAIVHWRGKPAMTAVAKYLAGGVNTILAKRVLSLRRDSRGWVAQLEGGKAVRAAAVLLTPPVPQSLALLEAGRYSLPAATRTRLGRIAYEPCVAVLAVLEDPSRIPAPGGFAPAEGPIAWIADNHTKGVSAVPAVTIHANSDFSMRHWKHDRDEVGSRLLEAAKLLLGGAVAEFQVHRWLYSRPTSGEECLCVTLSQAPPLILAGDALAGRRLEDAARSGWAAADAMRALIQEAG